MIALWLMPAALPLDNLVEHQHGQMVRAPSRPWQGGTPQFAANAAVRAEEWHSTWGRALMFLPSQGRPVKGLIAVSREAYAGLVEGLTPASWQAAGRDHPLSTTLPHKVAAIMNATDRARSAAATSHATSAYRSAC